MTRQTISHYKIVAKIWEDAAGTVYNAVDTENNRPVAIRTLDPGIAADAGRRRRMEHDARIASELQHPNIARVFEFSHSDGEEFAVLESPEGESLHDFLNRKRPRSSELSRFAADLASALAAAHAAGVVHGPMNPEAIYITPNENIKFHDFGFTTLDPPPESEEARHLAFGRSAPYTSPEQAEGAPDIRSDIFSLGALLYHLTAGRLPFKAETVSGTWKAMRKQTPRPLAEFRSRIPPAIEKVIDQALRKDPERRFQQMGEIVQLLATMPSAGSMKRRMRLLGANPRRTAKIAGIALVATATVAATAVWWRTRPPGERLIGKQLHQVTTNAGYDTEPAFSSDGAQLAYASDRKGEGNLQIWIQPADGGEARQITAGPDDNHEPAFSPDGATIAFRSERSGGGVYLVSTKGGDARLLAPEGRRPRYSPDGRWIAYWVGPPGFAPKTDGAYKVFIIPSGGGAPKPIGANFASAAYPVWSPDGKSLLFFGWPDSSRAGAGSTDWFVARVEGAVETHRTGACRTLQLTGTRADTPCGVPADWKGRHIYFTVPVGGVSQIWRADIIEGSLTVSAAPVRITSEKYNSTHPVASGKGRIAFTQEAYTADVWGIPVRANEGKVTGQPRRWTHDPGIAMAPSMSLDGARLSFLSNRTGHFGSWVLDTQSGKESPLLSKSEEQLWPLISPDGTKVAYSEALIGRVEQFYVPIGGAGKAALCDDCAAAVSGWSRDGRMVLVDSFAGATRRLAIALIKLPSLEKILLLEDPRYDLNQARFSPDERRIAFAATPSGGTARLFVAPFHGRAPSPPKEWIALTDGTAWETLPQWSPDGTLVYFTSTRDGYRCVWAQRLDGTPFGVAHFHRLRKSPVLLPRGAMDLFVAQDQILVSLGDPTGNIWSAKVPE